MRADRRLPVILSWVHLPQFRGVATLCYLEIREDLETVSGYGLLGKVSALGSDPDPVVPSRADLGPS